MEPDQNGRVDVTLDDAPLKRGANALNERVDIRTAIAAGVFPVALNRSKPNDAEVANAEPVERRDEKGRERGAKTFGLLGRLAVFDVIIASASEESGGKFAKETIGAGFDDRAGQVFGDYAFVLGVRLRRTVFSEVDFAPPKSNVSEVSVGAATDFRQSILHFSSRD